jgi:hypothetical protein
MTDLAYNIETMELSIKDGDFVLSSNLSEQNGSLFLYTKNCNLYFPLAGVGIGQQTVNSGSTVLASELNRWQSQVKGDGAKNANWSQSEDEDGNLVFQTSCEYE